ncbi:MAG TPA: glycosyltransferase family 2 protein [Blastocatellia bacterium]|jgi:dolichol-phosphate mannosyltransferase
MAHKYLVVIPAYNEEETIEQVIRLSQPYADVCIVDDASTDATPQILARLNGVHTIRHQKNTHIAGAILDGMRYAVEAGYDFCITMDAGMSHDPKAIPDFKQQTSSDLVIGYRRKKMNVPFYRKALSLAGTTLINLALNRGRIFRRGPLLRDVTSGYRMYSRRALELLLRSDTKSRSFDFHLEALAFIYLNGMSVKEIPITYVHSNSSLRLKVVGHALQTWWRIFTSSDFRASAEA